MNKLYRHFGQIITHKKYIIESIHEIDDALQGFIIDFLSSKNDDENLKRLIASILWWINKLVYINKDKKISKLNEKSYKMHLFESTIPDFKYIKAEDLEIYKKYYRVVDFYIHMLAVDNEVYLPKEFEYVIKYVKNHKTLVDKPLYENKNSIFPYNLKDFDTCSN